ncbi:MAG: DUF4956 domain-containing protein [Anaeroplasmataceae bacterium]|nr:DUF4956 domain-containing protein [Anaeroplasmataceae bacterium]
MLNNIFKSLFDTNSTSAITVANFFICGGVALILGALLAVSYTLKSRYTKSFAITIALLPTVVCVVIMLVNGNIGAGVAVAGAFSLVRFRSAPGSAKEIVTIFIAMCIGLLLGMGYVAYAVIFTIIMSAILFALNITKIWNKTNGTKEKTLRITIPEDLNYTEVFDDLFKEYTESYEVIYVKTTNMGSMFKLKYNIILKDTSREKEFIDALRCRNGNLEIMISNQEENANEL